MSKKVIIGAEPCAHVLFTELVTCKREGSVFYAGGRSKDYERCGAMTVDYTRELVAKLGALLAEHDAEAGITVKPAPIIDDIQLARGEGKTIAFEAFADGKKITAGAMTETVARKAKAFLDDLFDPKNVVRFKRHAGVVLALCLLEPLARVLG